MYSTFSTDVLFMFYSIIDVIFYYLLFSIIYKSYLQEVSSLEAENTALNTRKGSHNSIYIFEQYFI